MVTGDAERFLARVVARGQDGEPVGQDQAPDEPTASADPANLKYLAILADNASVEGQPSVGANARRHIYESRLLAHVDSFRLADDPCNEELDRQSPADFFCHFGRSTPLTSSQTAINSTPGNIANRSQPDRY